MPAVSLGHYWAMAHNACAIYGMMLEARCQQLDTFCHRLEGLVAQLVGAIESLPKDKILSPRGSADEELQRAAHALQSLPGPRDVAQTVPDMDLEIDASGEVECDVSISLEADSDVPVPLSVDEDIEDELNSYGALRFIGGATNNMLVEAVQSITPGQSLESDSPVYGSSKKDPPAYGDSNPPFEIPFFVHGQKWRELPYLPKPEQLSRPPQQNPEPEFAIPDG
ncbi:hypothetical protein G7Z17_g6762 [Cylindrodendrum hubeiense]|uniref:Uncharacterized protein n=1 Tax=Cylindrodendrum hubeiense TaxID=595255 RepID=A0A9P5HBQ6_9HYPO|nr:hypothetical protein G7Z17_g6762 [Cylindrodendrum hubeiense]